MWTLGRFEPSELRAAFRLSQKGSYAFDVGANVGLFTVVMSRAVGPAGKVIAIEPVANTVAELLGNVHRNECMNVEVVQGAAAATTGPVQLTLTDDPALHTAGGGLLPGHPITETTTVNGYTLDEIWLTAGRPRVSLLKVDVEGGEQAVLLGAERLISECRPALIIEVNDPRDLPAIAELLPGYRAERERGFESWNHLILPVGPRQP